MGLRDEMPTVTKFVDELREAFGVDPVNAWLLGRDGGAFWASEAGHEWGERPELGGKAMDAEAYLRLGQPLLPTESTAAAAANVAARNGGGK